MSLIVSPTGAPNADAYVEVADADTYFANRDNPAQWTGASEATKETAIRYATIWLDGSFSWIGYVVNPGTGGNFDGSLYGQPAQSLAWPRLSAFDDDYRLFQGIPQRVADACCEMALSHIRDGALWKVFYNPNPFIKSVRAGSVSVDFREGQVDPADYEMVQRILRGLYVAGGQTAQIVRS
jgi:hypothetical protein